MEGPPSKQETEGSNQVPINVIESEDESTTLEAYKRLQSIAQRNITEAEQEQLRQVLESKIDRVRLLSVRHSISGLLTPVNECVALPEDLLADLFRVPDTDDVSVGKLVTALKSFGLHAHDPRLKPMIDKIDRIELERNPDDTDKRHWVLSREDFKEVVSESIVLVTQVLRNNLAIPDWTEFCSRVTKIYETCKANTDGNVASYIPQLQRMDPNLWGVSICTVDGQRHSWGDSRTPFSFQSTSKAFNYVLAASDLGAEYVHKFVGQEPSGRFFNELCLDSEHKPHNPMVNAGAIIVSSLLKPDWNMADRFDYMLEQYKKLAGGEFIGFNNAIFLSERETANRNFALSYYMKEYDCFPHSGNVRDFLDFYFQLCSLEGNCESVAVMAATLANGGVCPLTGAKCLDNRPCRDVLSLMYSCGMYDYSGQFAFHVGLPAKSGVSGALIIVVPNVMGICLFSPSLDRLGNSCRGVQFCQELVSRFNFHNYDSLLHAESKKYDPRKRTTDIKAERVVYLLFAAKSGDIGAMRRFFLQGGNLEVTDYDGRTALHVAASEGHAHLVEFLLGVAKVAHDPRDRWNRTPLQDAVQFGHKKCVAMLEKAASKLQAAPENANC